MRIKYFVFPAVAILAGCAFVDAYKTVITVENGQTKCIEQTPEKSSAENSIRWCTSRQMFKPNTHTVKVGSTTLFSGVDYEDVQFEKKVGSENYIGNCTPMIDITDMKTSRSVIPNKLPPELVAACKITADNSGRMMPFVRTPACAAVYSKTIGPLIGELFPFKRAQSCNVTANGTQVFKGLFYYQ